ncbi:DMT family transporter [Candidatus Pelagibacter sp.]|nr:DMT family transporter [Candidatus Pelagibacter sp.]
MNWIIVAISGAFFQNLRSTLQKKLNQKVSTIASTYVRFAFALPFVTILFFLYFQDLNVIPEILSQKKFIFNVLLGSIFQIIFTFILLYLFRFANFVVGTSLSKTEVIQVAIFEYLIIGDKLNKFGITGIIVSTIGVIILSIKDLSLFLKNLFSKTTLIGLSAGLFLGVSVVYFRAAALTLENFSNNFEKAIATLFFGLVIQTTLISLYLIIFEKSQFKKLYENKYECLIAGFAGFLATLSWFYAFTLIQSSFVRAVGQIELLFSYVSSKYMFKEKVKITEILGIIIFVVGVLILLLNKS